MRAIDMKRHGEKVTNMGYYAETKTVDFELSKENFKEVEVRFQKLMDSPHPSGYNNESWRENMYGVRHISSNVLVKEPTYYETASKKFSVDDIFNTFGFEYEENLDKDDDDYGNINYIEYPEANFDSPKIVAFLSLFNGLVNEGCFIEWLGSEGDDNRWINYYHNGKWSSHNGVMDVTYPSLKELLGEKE